MKSESTKLDSTALHTDHYELTMLDAALRDGTADRRAIFEVFTRHLPPGATYGVFCGLGRLLEALERFRFGPDELDWLAGRNIVGPETLGWLADYRFAGDIDAYAEGELYGARSPVATIDGTFGQSVLLETLVLSILNHDSAVAAAGSRIVTAAHDRPLIEMGSRRTDPDAAVAAARAAYLVGFASTSNLEAGRRHGIPTAGTAAHAFVMAYPSEREAFVAQVAAFGPGTTLLVDTYDTEEGIRNAVAAAGPRLGAIRIDSGDLAMEAARARTLLDELGATRTRVIVTGDLDEQELAELADSPIDGYGIGTAVVMGGGRPTAGFVYKLVAVANDDAGTGTGAPLRPVAKCSPGKEGTPGRKWAWRLLDQEQLDQEQEEVATDPAPPQDPSRPLQVPVVRAGHIIHRPSLENIRAHHDTVRAQWPRDRVLKVKFRSRGDAGTRLTARS
jgi:nicotinate phosphoribosyltransferase